MAKVGGEEATASILDSVDPIFAAIEGHRIADAALVRAKSDNELDRCGDISWERYEALLATTPISKAGVPLCFVTSTNTKLTMGWVYLESTMTP